MSCVDGLQLLERLNALNREHSHDPLSVATGTAVQAMKAGAAGFHQEAVRGPDAHRGDQPGCVTPNTSIASACRYRDGRQSAAAVDRSGTPGFAAVLDGSEQDDRLQSRHQRPHGRVHRANVMAKMEARNLAELLRMVLTSRCCSLLRHAVRPCQPFQSAYSRLRSTKPLKPLMVTAMLN